MKTKVSRWISHVVVLVFVFVGTNVFAEFPSEFLSHAVMIKMPTANGTNSGSGFYYKKEYELFFVTARHVLFGRNPNSTNLISTTNATLTSYPNPESSDDRFELTVNLE